MARATKRIQNEKTGVFETKFDISVGKTVTELSEQGYSLEAIAGQLGVSRRTLYNWVKKYPEFAELCEIASDKRLFAWETKMIKAESGPSVQAASLALRGSGLGQWQDKKQIDVSVETNHKINLETMSPEEIKALMSIVQKQETLAIEAEYEEVGE